LVGRPVPRGGLKFYTDVEEAVEHKFKEIAKGIANEFADRITEDGTLHDNTHQAIQRAKFPDPPKKEPKAENKKLEFPCSQCGARGCHDACSLCQGRIDDTSKCPFGNWTRNPNDPDARFCKNCDLDFESEFGIWIDDCPRCRPKAGEETAELVSKCISNIMFDDYNVKVNLQVSKTHLKPLTDKIQELEKKTTQAKRQALIKLSDHFKNPQKYVWRDLEIVLLIENEIKKLGGK